MLHDFALSVLQTSHSSIMIIGRRQRRRIERYWMHAFRTGIFSQSLNTLQHGLAAIADLLIHLNVRDDNDDVSNDDV